MSREEAMGLLKQLVSELGVKYPDLRYDTITDLVNAGEPRVAIEILCDNLFDESKRVPIALFKRLEELARFFGVDPGYCGSGLHE